MINEIENQVLRWASDRGLLFECNRDKQALKMVEEIGEVCRAVLKEDKPELVDGIGDVMVTLTILAYQFGYDLEYCYQTAYDVIKDRTGKTVNGTFIKSGD